MHREAENEYTDMVLMFMGMSAPIIRKDRSSAVTRVTNVGSSKFQLYSSGACKAIKAHHCLFSFM